MAKRLTVTLAVAIAAFGLIVAPGAFAKPKPKPKLPPEIISTSVERGDTLGTVHVSVEAARARSVTLTISGGEPVPLTLEEAGQPAIWSVDVPRGSSVCTKAVFLARNKAGEDAEIERSCILGLDYPALPPLDLPAIGLG